MKLEFVKVREVGASLRLPRIPDTLRIVLILWERSRPAESRAPDRRTLRSRGPGPGRPIPRGAAAP
jgi:hypothetical protein